MNEQALLCFLLAAILGFAAWMGYSSGTVSVRGRDVYREESPGFFWFVVSMMAVPAVWFAYNGFLVVTGKLK